MRGHGSVGNFLARAAALAACRHPCNPRRAQCSMDNGQYQAQDPRRLKHGPEQLQLASRENRAAARPAKRAKRQRQRAADAGTLVERPCSGVMSACPGSSLNQCKALNVGDSLMQLASAVEIVGARVAPADSDGKDAVCQNQLRGSRLVVMKLAQAAVEADRACRHADAMRLYRCAVLRMQRMMQGDEAKTRATAYHNRAEVLRQHLEQRSGTAGSRVAQRRQWHQ